ncbi:MAG: 2-oxoacid:ferredoxin oxidoreductase subunit beta [Actinomycetota bacterium]|nr:2-oxoacid:ferredoxin oxidoreductase subunit beta [Actinomycetota bacterium]
MTEARRLTRKDFTSDQEVRWCPGCGDYAILAAVQSLLPELGCSPERTVFVSGIGCAARFPYYLATYGMHGIHGRAPAIATGLAATRPDLDIFVVTGDGDALSIGGNHLIHALRRNVNLKILLFNNEIYGLTKGQFSPTSRLGQLTKSSPMGAIDQPFNPVSLALGAEATFVARTLDSDRAHLQGVLRAAHEHRGSAFVEIYQNCVVFNDDAFSFVTDRASGHDNRIELRHAEPILFGPDDDPKAVVTKPGGGVEIVPATEAGDRVVVHDAHADDPTRAFALSRLSGAGGGPTPMGIFRQVERPLYEERLAAQLTEARLSQGDGDLQALLESGPVWDVAG